MVKPGFLKNDSVMTWLDGVEPAWSLLDYESYCRLRLRPDEGGNALLLKSDLSATDVGASPIVTATLHLLRMASETGVKLTESGKLSRSMVAELADIVAGPAFDLALIQSITKVLNEIDVWPAELLRHVVLDLRLVRRKGNVLVPTAKGQTILATAQEHRRRAEGRHRPYPDHDRTAVEMSSNLPALPADYADWLASTPARILNHIRRLV